MKTATGWMRCAVLLGGGLLLPMCGSSSGNGGTPQGTASTITIQNNAFSPLDVTVAAGATVTVTNLDAVPHSVTSETAKGSLQPGAANGVSFDTGTFTGTKSFVIAASAASGTVVPYYCRVHLGNMPQGTITIQ
jgi:plastocyanin